MEGKQTKDEYVEQKLNQSLINLLSNVREQSHEQKKKKNFLGQLCSRRNFVKFYL